MLVATRQPDATQPANIALVAAGGGNAYVVSTEALTGLTAPQASTQVVTAGNVVTLTNKTINTATFTGSQAFNHAGSGKSLLALTSNAAAVNGWQIAGGSPGAPAQLIATGDDTDVSIRLIPKGNGVILSGLDPVGVKRAVPASATATGKLGDWAADNGFIYVCTAADTWRRAALQTW
jgi:hypothetical protein